MENMYTIGVRKIQAALEQRKPLTSFFTDRYFSNAIYSDDESVRIETRRKGVVALPSVRRGDSPHKLADVAPHTVERFTPPYHFFEASVTAEETKQRVFGEPVGTPYSRAERGQVILAEKLYDGFRDSMLMTVEAYASELLKTGKVTPVGQKVDGEQFNFSQIAFDVDSSLVGITAEQWTVSSNIPSQLGALCQTLYNKNGIMPTEVILGASVVPVFMGNSKVEKLYDVRRHEGSYSYNVPMERYPGAALLGTINIPFVGTLTLFTYTGAYKYKDDDTETKFIGDNDIIITTPNWGSIAYGALQTIGAGGFPDLVPGRMLTHVEEAKPSTGFAPKGYVQSAPLAIPTQLDSWIYADVLTGT